MRARRDTAGQWRNRIALLLLPTTIACSLLAPTDQSLFGGVTGSIEHDADVDGDSGVQDAGEGGADGASTAHEGGTHASGGTSGVAIGGAPPHTGGANSAGGTHAATGGAPPATGGAHPATGGAPPATGGASPNGNCKYGSTGNNGDSCSVGEGIWRCVVSSDQGGVWVSQVCQRGAWVTFHLNPRDCAGCCGAESSACCQANYSCSLVN